MRNWPIFVFVLFTAGCEWPFPFDRVIRYSVTYSVDGQKSTIESTYNCHLVRNGWLSEGGGSWQIRGGGPIHVAGTFSNGERFVVEPVDARALPINTNVRCTESSVDVDSEMFVFGAGGVNHLISVDAKRTRLGGHNIKIERSTLSFDGIGLAGVVEVSRHAHTADRIEDYYTISARVINLSDLDRAGSASDASFRDYLHGRKSIWIEGGQPLPFVEWGQEDIEAARKYEEAKPFLYFLERGIDLSGNYSNGVWNFEKQGSVNAIDWLPEKITEQQEPRLSDKDIPRDVILYKTSRIELPTAKYPARHFYDPTDDTVVVFYLVRERVQLP